MNYKVRLTKLYRPQDIPGGLRTDVIEGFTYSLPEVGAYFAMSAQPLTEGATLRAVSTSLVEKTQFVDRRADGIQWIEFDTKSGSKYQLEILEERKNA